MPTCPECGNAYLTQLEDKYTMICGDGHYFILLRVPSKKLEKSYANRLYLVLTKIVEILWEVS